MEAALFRFDWSQPSPSDLSFSYIHIARAILHRVSFEDNANNLLVPHIQYVQSVVFSLSGPTCYIKAFFSIFLGQW